MCVDAPSKLTFGEVTWQVADEWRAEGKRLTVPPDTPDDTDEHAFWDEVERRYNEQAST